MFLLLSFDGHAKVSAAVNRLNDLDWFKAAPLNISEAAQARRRSRFTSANAFRGTSVGDEVGPYISQFFVLRNC